MSSKDLGHATLISIPLCILSAMGVAWYSSKTARFRLPLVMMNFIGLITLLVVMALLNFKRPWVFTVGLLLLQVCLSGHCALALEFLA